MKRWIIYSVFGLLTTGTRAQPSPFSAADHFLSSLSPTLKSRALQDRNSPERFNWHFFPKNYRPGVAINDLNELQRSALFELMKTCLSQTGFKQVRGVMQMEAVLKQLEARPESDHYRDTGKYYSLFFGNPSPDSAWSWRIEGHHVSFSFTVLNNKVVSGTPGFLGSNPALVREGPKKGTEILKMETELAFRLVGSLNREDRRRAIVSTRAPGEILTFVSRKAVIENPGGISYAQLNSAQQDLMLRLIEVYILRYTHLFADEMLKEMHVAGLEKLRFAWAGSTERENGLPYYYRITGPTLIIEFDNAQNNANHVHTVVRDRLHDFGEDVLVEHYRENH